MAGTFGTKLGDSESAKNEPGMVEDFVLNAPIWGSIGQDVIYSGAHVFDDFGFEPLAFTLSFGFRLWGVEHGSPVVSPVGAVGQFRKSI
ncbi:MAG TPA: hypothetical protein VN736_15115 [Candidatus Limnocylindrales bacterium]|nr:hypothetical protein [Candidatus Limnocylindrales bacterium]